MSTLNQLREGLNRAWDSLQEGWNHLRGRAGHALTRFHPARRGGQVETADDQVVRNATHWALLPAEVIEHANEVVVKLEMPGMEREDFDISIVDNVLVVRGEKRLQREQVSGRYYVLECAYGSFERAIPLPVMVDDTRTHASYRNGVLRVTLPKIGLAQSKRIPVISA